MYCLYPSLMRIILSCLFIVISAGSSYASVLYTTPAVFPPPDRLIVTWAESVTGAGEKEFGGALDEVKKGNYIIALNRFEQIISIIRIVKRLQFHHFMPGVFIAGLH